MDGVSVEVQAPWRSLGHLGRRCSRGIFSRVIHSCLQPDEFFAPLVHPSHSLRRELGVLGGASAKPGHQLYPSASAPTFAPVLSRVTLNMTNWGVAWQADNLPVSGVGNQHLVVPGGCSGEWLLGGISTGSVCWLWTGSQYATTFARPLSQPAPHQGEAAASHIFHPRRKLLHASLIQQNSLCRDRQSQGLLAPPRGAGREKVASQNILGVKSRGMMGLSPW